MKGRYMLWLLIEKFNNNNNNLITNIGNIIYTKDEKPSKGCNLIIKSYLITHILYIYYNII